MESKKEGQTKSTRGVLRDDAGSAAICCKMEDCWVMSRSQLSLEAGVRALLDGIYWDPNDEWFTSPVSSCHPFIGRLTELVTPPSCQPQQQNRTSTTAFTTLGHPPIWNLRTTDNHTKMGPSRAISLSISTFGLIPSTKTNDGLSRPIPTSSPVHSCCESQCVYHSSVCAATRSQVSLIMKRSLERA